MKTKILVLCITLLGLLGYFSLAKSQDETKATGKSQNSILFNGWYGRIKEKWQGPLHNTVVFTWYTGLTSAENEQAYRKLVNNQRKNGVKFIGYYYSATTSYPSTNVGRFNRFPEGAIPPEAIKYSWILRDTNGQLVTWPGRKNRWFIDIGKSEVQDAILTRAIKNAKRLGANVLNLDNWNYKSFAPAGQTKEQWAEKNLALLIRARELTHQHNLKLVVNQASPFEHWHKFAPYLDGFAFEQSTHSIWLTKRNLYEMELNTYEQMMAMGKSLFLFTYIYSETRKAWDPDGRKVATTALLVMPQDNPHWGGIYVSLSGSEVWPVGGWTMWPEQLGKPLGPRKWDGNTITRKFEHGSISVTVGEKPKFNIHFEY